MGRKKSAVAVTPGEPLKARCLMTETGYPASLSLVRETYGDMSMPSPEDGWFWIFATKASAMDIRRRGLHAVGTVMTTYIPRQREIVVDPDCTPDQIPVIGTLPYIEAMIEETRAKERQDA